MVVGLNPTQGSNFSLRSKLTWRVKIESLWFRYHIHDFMLVCVHVQVLDMCAAPGSKTAQLIEMIHADDGGSPHLPSSLPGTVR